MNWLLLIVAGLFEVVWATALKYTEGFTKPVPSLITVAAMVVSFYLLSLALRSIPLGSGYAVWVGIGAVGTAVLGVIAFHEPITPLKILSLLLVVAGIIGLKISSVG